MAAGAEQIGPAGSCSAWAHAAPNAVVSEVDWQLPCLPAELRSQVLGTTADCSSPNRSFELAPSANTPANDLMHLQKYSSWRPDKPVCPSVLAGPLDIRRDRRYAPSRTL